uniref:NADH-ubiquinone oxidoreductase chain 5 n=1 Tax=Liogluta microptera TaxID=866049 RepID=A0A0S2M7K1_LIOMI|nr:NADH dehydrogenase subunit 5 [Liogluta microptera]ALO70653.1 NADH deshydrogenase subunit 5 [Liogluta microptera]
MISICLIYFMSFLVLSMSLFISSLFLIMSDLVYIFEYKLLTINSSSIMMVILVDWMSLLFMSFVLYISSMVIYYSDEYMSGDPKLNRFIMLVSMFVLSMMLLIISPNLISILLGWDGLGLVSYCLVIYYQNIKSYNAGMLTALTNRIGDVALLLGIAWMLNYGSWNYIFYLEFMKNDLSMSIMSWLVVLAAMTKSAQIPFSSWLPAAMAAPTPVSSLVHSSTLVTAGVYLLIRFNYALSFNLLLLLLLFGTMTMFMAGLGANFEFDLKKIIALSTLSQLGLMMSILALGEYKLSFFHLLSHALFKATLFMCAGCIIHNLNNCQDIRFMGSLVKQMPLTCCFFNIANLSLCGIPFLAGFYSKDLILEVLSMNYLNLFIYLIFFISTGLTVSYSFRLVYYTMVGDYNFLALNCLQDYGKIMLKGMAGLIFLVIMGGSSLMWLMFPTPYFICLPFIMKMMALLVTFFGMWLGIEFSLFSINYSLKSMMLLKTSLFFSSMWNMPMLSTFGMNYFMTNLGKTFYLNIDQGWSEYFGSQKIFINMKKLAIWNQFIFLNNLKIFFLLMVLYMIVLFFMFLYLNSL